MANILKAFEVDVNGKALDYRVGAAVDMEAVQRFFRQRYIVNKLWMGGRHVLGELDKDGKKLFLKLATTEGISEVTKNEHRWNEAFHIAVPQKSSEFQVPANVEDGLFQDTLYFLVTDMFDGTLLVDTPEPTADMSILAGSIESVVRFSEFIQTLPFHDASDAGGYREHFLVKVRAWYDAIPPAVRERYGVEELLHIVEKGTANLKKKPRHGDFTPWHIMKLSDGRLGLIDGEHYMASGVQYYDIGYFIQRVYSVLRRPNIAEEIYARLIGPEYEPAGVRIILAARGIGGFLDASLAERPEYAMSDAFKVWVMKLS